MISYQSKSYYIISHHFRLYYIIRYLSYPITLHQKQKIPQGVSYFSYKTNNLKVNTFCQSFENSKWIDLPTNASSGAQLENAILNKAKKIKLAKN